MHNSGGTSRHAAPVERNSLKWIESGRSLGSLKVWKWYHVIPNLYTISCHLYGWNMLIRNRISSNLDKFGVFLGKPMPVVEAKIGAPIVTWRATWKNISGWQCSVELGTQIVYETLEEKTECVQLGGTRVISHVVMNAEPSPALIESDACTRNLCHDLKSWDSDIFIELRAWFHRSWPTWLKFFASSGNMGVSENSAPLHPMVNDHYPY